MNLMVTGTKKNANNEPKDQSGDILKAIDYLTAFQEALPGMIENVLPDLDIDYGSTPAEVLANNEFTATLAAKEMTLDECCSLIAGVFPINGFQATMQGINHEFMKGKNIGDAIREADDFVMLLAAYIIEVILSVNPSLITQALAEKQAEAGLLGGDLDFGKDEGKK